MSALIEGIVKDGVIRLPNNIHLPENARIYVIVEDRASLKEGRAASIASPRLIRSPGARELKMQVCLQKDQASGSSV